MPHAPLNRPRRHPSRALPGLTLCTLLAGLGLSPSAPADVPGGSCSAIGGPVGRLTPSDDVPEAVGWRAQTLIEGLQHPWGIAWLPDGDALVTERPGRLRRIHEGRLEPRPIGGLPTILVEGQGGLLDIALHPDFEHNQLVYLTFASGTPAANRTSLARGRLDGDQLRDLTVIFRNPDAKADGQHFGSRLLFLPDGTLLMSIGDGGNPPTAFAGDVIRKQAQNRATLFGKLIRLRDDGTAPPDNPFASQVGARPELYTLGHRNVQGLTSDGDGRVWATEHGSRGGDELNLIGAGNNYGWPEVTYSMEYWGPCIANVTARADVTDPIHLWTPSKAPSGLAFYTGPDFPAWRGSLFSGALRNRELRRLGLAGTGVVAEEKLSIGQRVRDVRQGPDGGLYVLTDEADGALLRIVPDPH